jgi:group I intron endonuclease
MTTGIYFIQCISNKKYYVGQAYDIEKRLNGHLKELRRGVHHNKGLQSDFSEYGESNFNYGLLEVTDKNKVIMTQREQYWMNDLRSSYNLVPANYVPFTKGSYVKWKLAISKSLKGRFISDEWKENISKGSKGRKLSDDAKRKVSMARKGKKLSSEHKEKISKSKKGVPNPKVSLANKGKPMKNETKKKLSKAMKNRKILWSNKISKAMIKIWQERKSK